MSIILAAILDRPVFEELNRARELAGKPRFPLGDLASLRDTEE